MVDIVNIFPTSSYAQEKPITIRMENAPIVQLFDEIHKQSEFVFFYKDSQDDLKKNISFELEDQDIKKILDQAFYNTSLGYRIYGRQIVIVHKEMEIKKQEVGVEEKHNRVSFFNQPEMIRIRGKVSDKISGEPIPGANIIIHNTTTGTITNLNGEFSSLSSREAKLFIVSFIGYEKQEIQITPPYYYEILMTTSAEELGEAVFTTQALGQIGARRQQINSLTIKNVISPEKLQQNPDANAIEAIGRLPGISVDRHGGEGAGFRLRGLDQSYSNVTINGEPLPVGLNSISTYALQGVEVYKSLTPNLEGNAVAGTIDLTLRQAPKGFHYSVLAQSGYKTLNNDFSNYSLSGHVSNRFFNDKLGILLMLNAENANRSVDIMSVGFNTQYTTNPEAPFYISHIGFNLTERINYKQSANLSIDYVASSSTLLNFYSFLSASNSYSSNQSKGYGPEGALATVPVLVNMSETPENRNYGISSAFNGKTSFRFLNSTLFYGLSHSYSKHNNPGSRSWSYSSTTRADGLHRDSLMDYTPARIANYFDEALSSLKETRLMSMNFHRTQSYSWSLTPRLDYEIPFDFMSGLFNGKIRVGGKYRRGHSVVDNTSGSASAGGNTVFDNFMNKTFDWSTGVPSVELLVTGQNDNFLEGDYIFGDVYSFERNNLVFDAWNKHGQDAFLAGPTGGLSDNPQYSGFIYNLSGSAMGDIDQTGDYAAGYIMPEINIGKWAMLIPGFRYEYHGADMKSYRGYETTLTHSIHEDIVWAYNLKDSVARREDKFLLPMFHLRIKPTNWFYTHLSYTHTLRRPGGGVAPFEYYNSQMPGSFSYTVGNPELKTELWRSYDLQFTFHNNKIGLFSITGFNKTVENKLWSRSYMRIQGEPIPHPVFKENDLVMMTVYENHPYDITLRGFEVEWQTSFWYLPKPLSFFTLSANYTYTHGESPNPYTSLFKYRPPGSRYELTGRTDSVVVEPMTGQPKHMANVTLGINIKGFSSYLSYQYAADKIEGTHPNDLRLYVMREPYSRVDFNASYGFNFKNTGILELILKIANLTNSEDRIRYREEFRPMSVEKYGLTVDLGVRYKF